MTFKKLNLSLYILSFCLVLLGTTAWASDKYGGGSTSSGSSSSGSGNNSTYSAQRAANQAYNARTLPSTSGSIRPGMTSSVVTIGGRTYTQYTDSYTPGGAPPSRPAFRSIDSNSNNSGSRNGNFTPPGNSPNGVVFPGIFIRPATGYFDLTDSSACSVTGWAYDPDNSATSIDVHVYKDGRAGVGTFVTSCIANTPRPDVNRNIRIPGNHGFNCSLPTSFRNTGNHALFIHAIDINGTPNNLLQTNGKTINCAGPATPATPTPPTPQCNDSIDNGDTEDTLIDMTDPGCSSPSDDDEYNVVLPPTITANGQSTLLIIRAGTPVTIEWSSNGNTNCRLSSQLPQGVVTSGLEIENPTSESLYTISCDQGSESVIVKVLPVFQET